MADLYNFKYQAVPAGIGAGSANVGQTISYNYNEYPKREVIDFSIGSQNYDVQIIKGMGTKIKYGNGANIGHEVTGNDRTIADELLKTVMADVEKQKVKLGSQVENKGLGQQAASRGAGGNLLRASFGVQEHPLDISKPKGPLSGEAVNGHTGDKANQQQGGRSAPSTISAWSFGMFG